LKDSTIPLKKPCSAPDINEDMTPLRIRIDNHVFHVYAIAKTGNNVFNAHIVNNGDTVIKVKISKINPTKKKHPKQPSASEFFISFSFLL
jgi:hypothetical protein